MGNESIEPKITIPDEYQAIQPSIRVQAERVNVVGRDSRKCRRGACKNEESK